MELLPLPCVEMDVMGQLLARWGEGALRLVALPFSSLLEICENIGDGFASYCFGVWVLKMDRGSTLGKGLKTKLYASNGETKRKHRTWRIMIKTKIAFTYIYTTV